MSDSRPLAILVVDTDELVRMVTADMLADVGFQPIEVKTAAEALAVLEGPVAVRMLITGRRIGGDGIALARLVHRRWPDISIIVTTGAVVDLSRELPPGARVLSKPYSFKILIQEVEAGLAQVRADPSPAPVLPWGVPSHRGLDLGKGVGAVAAPASEPDKT